MLFVKVIIQLVLNIIMNDVLPTNEAQDFLKQLNGYTGNTIICGNEGDDPCRFRSIDMVSNNINIP